MKITGWLSLLLAWVWMPWAAGVLAVQVDARDGADTTPLSRVFLYQTGVARQPEMDSQQWLPGALADHLISFCGQLMDGNGQMSVLDWLESGATASYSIVSEPLAAPF